jgi:mercuric ion transport protein
MNSNTRTRLSYAGSLTTAGTVAATIFCCLPFATGLVGAGAAAYGARFAPLQPYLAGVSLALLAYAFYQAYRPGAVSCVGEHCDMTSSTRYRRVALWLVTVVVCLLLTAAWWANWAIYLTL